MKSDMNRFKVIGEYRMMCIITMDYLSVEIEISRVEIERLQNEFELRTDLRGEIKSYMDRHIDT